MSDLCRDPRKHLGINASNFFMYNINGRACALPRAYEKKVFAKQYFIKLRNYLTG